MVRNPALDALRYHVTGAIERGEATPIVEIPASINGDPGKLAIAYATQSSDPQSSVWDCNPGRFDYVLIRRDPATAEYRVNRVGAPEATAAYESDLESAYGTARAQAQWWSRATGRTFLVKYRQRYSTVDGATVESPR